MKDPCRRIRKLDGTYSFLSNSFDCPVVFDGVRYLNAEAAYQAQKMADKKKRKTFSDLDAISAKHLGKIIEIRNDWDEVKNGLMRDIIRAKFEQNEDLKKQLLLTMDIEIEVQAEDDDQQNLLGTILMEERKRFRLENEEMKQKKSHKMILR